MIRAKRITFLIGRTDAIECFLSSVRIGTINYFPDDERGEWNAIIFLTSEEIFLHSGKAAKQWMQDSVDRFISEIAEEIT
jgi:hypothetical protein